MLLAQRHAHPRDELIFFQEEGHLYTIRDLEGHPISVTTLIHFFFPEFDADVVIDKMMASRNWPVSKYYGMSKDEIKSLWETMRDDAAKAGTAMHKSIEEFLNLPELDQESVRKAFFESGKLPSSVPQTQEFCHFLRYWDDLLSSTPYRPYRTEWLVFDSDKRLSGSIDLILHNPCSEKKDEIVIVDWKRSKEIKWSNNWERGRECFSHLDNCNWNHYRLQLNIYRHLLETHYGKRVIDMYLVVLHPNNDSYVKITIERMEKEIHDIMSRLPNAAQDHDAALLDQETRS